MINSPFLPISQFWQQFCDSFIIDIEAKTEYTRIINLNRSSELLWQSIRKSYRPLINWGLKNMKIKEYDSKSITLENFSEFKAMHFECAKDKLELIHLGMHITNP